MIKTMTYQEYTREKNDDIILIDVREKGEFEFNHIPGAKNLPLTSLMFKWKTLNPELKYALICQSGSRSAMAGQFLASKGIDVVNIQGGMSALR